MKKYALVMATILSVGMMAGCGSHTEAPVTESVPVEETVQSTETDAVTEATPADTTPSATIGTTKCGYYFYEDGSGFVVDGNGNKYEAYPLEEDTANDYVRITIVGE